MGGVGGWGGHVFPIWWKTMERERDIEKRPPVKVISKWKAPAKIINRVIVCHFAPKIERLHVSGRLPVISHLFLPELPLSSICWEYAEL